MYSREQIFQVKGLSQGLYQWNQTNWEYLDQIGEDNFYIVPIKTIGFRPCKKHVPFIRSGKIIVKDPEEEDYYLGYWWDKEKNQQLAKGSKPKTWANRTGVWGDYRDYEYYYYLHENYHDN